MNFSITQKIYVFVNNRACGICTLSNILGYYKGKRGGYMFWSKKTKFDERLRLGAVTAFVVTLVLNGLAGSTTLIGGVNTAQISDANPSLFTPAGVTFSIWGLIYLLLVGFCAYLFGFGRDKSSRLKTETVNQLMKWFLLSSVFNSLWILAWQYQVLWLSVLLIIALLVSLVKAVELLRNKDMSEKEQFLVRLPFSVYFGWLTVATIANISTWLVSVNWDGILIRPGVWTVGLLLVGAVIGLVGALRNNDWAYLGVFVWAYAGILLKHLSPGGYNGMYPTIILTLVVLLPVFISTIMLLSRNTLQKRLQKF